MYKKDRIDIISMGCSKNLVDSERLLKKIEAKGYTPIHDSDDPKGEFVVVNTCGFIADAKEESINLILQLGEKKRKGKIGKLVVMGCLSERYLEQLKKEIPEVDIWYGKYDWKNFIDYLPQKNLKADSPKSWERLITTPAHSAYIKISEGCNRFCSFCAIPKITGRHTSRPIEEILEETASLVAKGVKEFNVIAQDLSSYGLDLYGQQRLPELIDRMADIPGVEWIRLHYAYPASFPMDLLDVIANRENVCKYLDIALQHISDKVLSNMRRHISKEETLQLIKSIREKVPGIKIRTTLMVGFPGEGEKEFNELIEFVESAKFDRMGAFSYSEEDDTFAAEKFEDSISEKTKKTRLDKIMKIQEDISLNNNEKMIGKKLRVLIDRIENGIAYGRSEFDSPEVDQEIIIHNSTLNPGDFIEVIIEEAYPFELKGKLI